MNTNDSNKPNNPSPENFPSFPTPDAESMQQAIPPSPEQEDLAAQKEKIEREKFEERVRDNLRDARDANPNPLDYIGYTKEQIITYTLLVIGIFLLFINSILGGFIIGVVAGYYFTEDIVFYLRNIGQILRGHDHLRYVTLTGLLLGLFITAPGIFIGAAIAAALKQVIQGGKTDI